MKELDELLIKEHSRKVNVQLMERVYNKTFAPGYILEEINGMFIQKPNSDLFERVIQQTDYEMITEGLYDIVNRSLERVKDSVITKFSGSKNSLSNMKAAIVRVIRKVMGLNILKRIEDKALRVTPMSKIKASRFVVRYLQNNRTIKLLNVINKQTNNSFTIEQFEEILARVLTIPDISKEVEALELHVDLPVTESVLKEANLPMIADKLLALSTIVSIAAVMMINMYGTDEQTEISSTTINSLIANIITTCLMWSSNLFTTKAAKNPRQ
jgi:hypothetical protein